MKTEVYPDRDQRLGGRWSTPDLIDEILRLALLERAVVHVAAGWVPRVPELDEKLRLASAIEDHMVRAVALRQHAVALLERDVSGVIGRSTWIEPLRALDATADAGAVASTLLGEVNAFLARRYRDLSTRLDPLYDFRLLATLRTAVDALDLQMLGSEPTVGPTGGTLSAALDAAWSDSSSPPISVAEALWAPQHRVPYPARPEDRARPEAGAMGFLRSGSRNDERNIVGELNENVIAELCAMELMCRCSYEHPDLSWAFHNAVVRHASDEARHAAIFRRLLAQRGAVESDLTQHAANYELAYEFPECEPGSKRELVWRLLLLCTVLEGLAIDKILPEIAALDWLGQPEIARALDYISTDELYHVENGLRLTRQLSAEHNLDPILERERVHGRFFGRQYEARMRYIDADPDRAAQEIAILAAQNPDGVPFTSRTEVELRKRASFTQAECEQVDRWGYNPRPIQGEGERTS